MKQSLLNIVNLKILNNIFQRIMVLFQESGFEIYISGKSTQGDRKYQIGFNIVKEKDGMFSEKLINEDEKKMSREESKNYAKIKEICIKSLQRKELLIISKDLAFKILERLGYYSDKIIFVKMI